jgi:DNA polymerase/3'-5' exonuclease PolX
VKEFTLNRKTYEKVRKMDHHTMADFFKDAFMKGYAEGKKSSLPKDELRTAIMGVKGVGEKKAEDIVQAIDQAERRGGVNKFSEN